MIFRYRTLRGVTAKALLSSSMVILVFKTNQPIPMYGCTTCGTHSRANKRELTENWNPGVTPVCTTRSEAADFKYGEIADRTHQFPHQCLWRTSLLNAETLHL
eukprot:gb/GECG01003758.1/.p1 GENE.gb/GECG01003758.1/~~gb/GECG01003758.1/.p1  ORF type:complete len:103 (+),score=5.67 gb/GECG01003758.1/:1-309(+)